MSDLPFLVEKEHKLRKLLIDAMRLQRHLCSYDPDSSSPVQAEILIRDIQAEYGRLSVKLRDTAQAAITITPES